jgi:hypothetical protein
VKSKSEPKSSPKIVKDYQSNRKGFGLIEFNKRLKKMKDEGKIY